MRPPVAVASLAAAVAMAVLLVGAPSAAASRGEITIFDATPSLIGGQAPSYRAGVLDRLAAMGVDTVRMLVPWRSLAPSPNSSTRPADFDPANPGDYPTKGFVGLDDAVTGAAARGMDVLMTPTGPVPDWASATGDSGLYRPDPAEFQSLVTALGLRYRGDYCPEAFCVPGFGTSPLPRVDFWAVWNEPNLKTFLRPQRNFRGKTVSGDVYRRLFLAAQRGLQVTQHGDDPLLIGETAPSRGSTSTPPLRFLRLVLCLSPRFTLTEDCDPIEAAGWAHHPYNPYSPPWEPARRRKQIIGIGSLYRLMRSLRLAAEARATVGRLPVYVTEYGVESFPDDKFGVSLQRQAEFIGISELLLYRDPWVRSFGQYLLSDDALPRGVFSFQTGLRFLNDTPKPSYDAFPITLVVRRETSSKVQIWGHVRPASGGQEVDVRFRDGEDEPSRLLDSERTDAGGYFSFEAGFEPGREWRVTAQLPNGRLLKGPFIRSYRFD